VFFYYKKCLQIQKLFLNIKKLKNHIIVKYQYIHLSALKFKTGIKTIINESNEPILYLMNKIFQKYRIYLILIYLCYTYLLTK